MSVQTREAKRWERTGLLAMDPKALVQLFIPSDAAPANVEIGTTTVIDVRGPLTTRDEYWSDSYESITRRVRDACESACTAIVLRLDSPGGEAQGCFEAAREIREICATAGKKLYAYVEGCAHSAAYALATAAQWIAVAETSTVGSVGVLSTRVDYSVQNAANGIRVAFIASGARKTDGHPDAPISEAELAAEQTIVDALADVFFNMVSEHRGVSALALKQLDARVLHGAAAVGASLADEISTFQSLLARIATGGMERVTMNYEKMRAAVEEIAGGDDANAKAAQAALAALQAAEGGKEGEEETPPEPDPEKEKEKEGAVTPEPDETASTEPAPPKSASAPALDMVAMARKIHELETKQAQRDEREEREKLVASRPDFGPEMIAIIRTTPIETARDLCAKLPKGKPVARTTKAGAADLQPGVKPTQGEGQTDGVSHLPPDRKAKLDRAMGLGAGVERDPDTPYRMTLSGTPAKTPAAKGSN